LNGVIKNSIGSKNTIVFGFFMMTISTIGLGLIAKIDNPHTFLYTAVGLRFFQGQGDVIL